MSDDSEKKGLSTVVKVLISLALLFVLFIGGLVLFYFNCEKCQKIVASISEGAVAIQQGMNAPGAAEVRELGCEQAMIVELRVFMDMVAPIVDEQPDAADDPALDTMMVSCTTSGFSQPTGPECGDVMRAYVSGAGELARDNAFVVVQGGGTGEPYCQGLYAKDGSFIGAFE